LTVDKLTKEVNDRDSFGFSFVGILPTGDNIASSSWDASDIGVSRDTPSFSATAQTTAVFLSGGVPGGQYIIRNDVVSVAGHKRQREFLLTVTDDA
jgi:hypothetical protein